MPMELQEFKNSIHGAPKKMKVTNSWGVYDAYKHMRKNGWYNIGRPVKEKEFYAIIRGVNKLLAEELGKGNTVRFPERMGTLELRKYQQGASIVNGKLKVTYPINWSDTLKLWYEDGEAYKNKTLLRFNEKYVYRVKYLVNFDNAKYENKCFYQFVLNRKIRKALKENIKKDKIDCLYEVKMN